MFPRPTAKINHSRFLRRVGLALTAGAGLLGLVLVVATVLGGPADD